MKSKEGKPTGELASYPLFLPFAIIISTTYTDEK